MENLDQMTLEQLTALQKKEMEHYTALTEEMESAKRNLRMINPILAQKMSHKSPLIGKKVKVVSLTYLGEERHIIGFFGGYYFSYGSAVIYPRVFKVKKDGSASKNQYSYYDVPSLKRIINIEEVTE